MERDSAVQLQGYDDRARVVEVKDPRTGSAAYTIKYDYRELLPLLRHRWEPEHPEVKRILTRERDVRMSIDARLQVAATEILARQLKQLGKERGALVALDPDNGDLLASVSLPAPALPAETVTTEENPGPLLDRARYGMYPPGSTFKVVTAIAALRRDPALAQPDLPVRAAAGRPRGELHRPFEAANSRRRAGPRPARHGEPGARNGGVLQRLLRAACDV